MEDLAWLGVTAANTVDVERRVLAQADLDTGFREDSLSADPEKVVALLEHQLLNVQQEMEAVQASLNTDDMQDEGSDSTNQGHDLQQAVGARRIHGLQAKQEQLVQALRDASAAEAAANRRSLNMEHSDVEVPAAQAPSAPAALLADDGLDLAIGGTAAPGPGLVETERDMLIRTGVLTPFASLDGFERRLQGGARRERETINRAREAAHHILSSRPSTRLLTGDQIPKQQADVRPFKSGSVRSNLKFVSPEMEAVGRTRMASLRRAAAARERAVKQNVEEEELQEMLRQHTAGSGPADGTAGGVVKIRRKRTLSPQTRRGRSSCATRKKARRRSGDSEEDESDEWDPDEEDDDGEEEYMALRRTGRARSSRQFVKASPIETSNDDSPPICAARRDKDRDLCQADSGADLEADVAEAEEEDEEEVVFEGNYRIPALIYDRLYDYQRTGVKWLWELHNQQCGGIIGDEMGLGKTVQVAAFLTGLHLSGMFEPSIVVCPATMLRQWRRELRLWCPEFRVVILHDSALTANKAAAAGGKARALMEMLHQVVNHPAGILLTTYEGLRFRREALLPIRWGYAILDEGHKIRNPDADITLVAKQLQTVHRVIMSGSPIQNRLTELWSLFDFVFPGKLGTLPVFQAMFSIPIQIGGYASASQLQVSTAYKCAVVLRDLIAPYLLRRLKADVNHFLPKKTEQVLFCPLSREQREVYRSYIHSEEVEAIVDGERDVLGGIDVLKKICNHPDLLERLINSGNEDYGNEMRSGKMLVLQRVLLLWKEQGHRALVFSQTRQMLDILEALCCKMELTYRRMDGCTAVGARMKMIDTFNNDESVFVFLLTTKVGGLGINLTGANRVILFDPDWNPCHDMQARERAWRIGQTKEVTVYRLITQGTIEEKIYHRQIFKQFLSNKILRDPRQRRFFKAKDISDLFTLTDDTDTANETADLFAEVDGEIQANQLEERPSPDQSDALHRSSVVLEAPPADPSCRLETAGACSSIPDEEKYDPFDSMSTHLVPASRNASHSRGSQTNKSKMELAGAGRNGVLGGGASERTALTTRVPGMEAGADAKSQQSLQSDDVHILKSLFGDCGIKSAMDHERIVGANNPENVRVDMEAERVARRAAEALRQSRASRVDDDVAVPTWTGRSGAGGAPPAARRRFGQTLNPKLYSSTPNVAESASIAPTSLSSSPFEGGAGLAPGKAPSSSLLLAQMRERRAQAATSDLGVAVPRSRLQPAVAPQATKDSAVVGDLASTSTSTMASNQASKEVGATNRFRGPRSSLGDGARAIHRIVAQPPVARFGRGAGAPRGRFAQSRSIDEDAETLPAGVPTPLSVHHMGREGAGIAGGKGSGAESSGRAVEQSVSADELMSELLSLLSDRQGSAPTNDIVAHFDGRLEDEKDNGVFRRVLRQIAVFKRDSGNWELRAEFA